MTLATSLFLRRSALTYSSSDQGYWTPSTSSTVWYTPTTTDYWEPTTTCYTSYYTPTSTWTTVYSQNEVIITYTSYLPCPVTSTVIYYTQTCQQCCYECETESAEPTEPAYGTTTFTSYTTTTPTPMETITSNGYVVVVMDSSTYASVEPTASVQYQVINDARTRYDPMIWVFSFCVAFVASLMVVL